MVEVRPLEGECGGGGGIGSMGEGECWEGYEGEGGDVSREPSCSSKADELSNLE